MKTTSYSTSKILKLTFNLEKRKSVLLFSLLLSFMNIGFQNDHRNFGTHKSFPREDRI